MLPCSASLEQFFKKLPRTYKWFLRCASHPGVLPAACNVYKLQETSFVCSNSVKCFSFPNDHEILKHGMYEYDTHFRSLSNDYLYTGKY